MLVFRGVYQLVIYITTTYLTRPHRPQKVAEFLREIPGRLFQENLGWWNKLAR